ncbi:hypothetical protein NM688_g2873 [Phlebia brevispora]|uniref:Uncharacterized protein n=1 Tax=Phlebia brevispora TaxID=194682 RepID=A0ACC1T7E5_9APHY|nr:hypothetical protein NM688_g2873 [Phlebia brevispora]
MTHQTRRRLTDVGALLDDTSAAHKTPSVVDWTWLWVTPTYGGVPPSENARPDYAGGDLCALQPTKSSPAKHAAVYRMANL